jgi:DNA mismatch repair protein MutS2
LFVDIGDDQSIESDLSTYSAHLSKMKKFVEDANGKTLILIDEFGTGTDPQFGGPIAEAVLEALNHKKVRGMVTTHYSNLKDFRQPYRGNRECIDVV